MGLKGVPTMQSTEIVVIDRASTPDEAESLHDRYAKSLESLGKTAEFEMLEPKFHNAGRNSHWEIRMLNLVVRAERIRAEEAAEAEARKIRAAQWKKKQEELARQREAERKEKLQKRAENEPLRRKKISGVNKGRTRPEGAGRKATLYRAFGESRSLREWSIESGIPEPTLRARISRGLSMPEALTRPLHQR